MREALFSRLQHAGVLEDACVLDLYAGSGALGLESASRGAAEVVLVESARAAAQVCRQNAAALGLPGVQVVAEKVLAYLRRPAGPGRVDVAFLDPPYDLPDDDLAEALAALVPHLADGAVVVVERDARTAEPPWPTGLAPTGDRRYGETVLWFATAVDPTSGAAPGPTVTT